MSHFCIKCSECGRVITQCRCFDPNKIITYRICGSCAQKAKNTVTSENIIKENQTESELNGILDLIPIEYRVIVREGAADENLFASVALSVAKLVREIEKNNGVKCQN